MNKKPKAIKQSGANTAYLVSIVLINNNLYRQVGLDYQAARQPLVKAHSVTQHFPVNQRVVGLRFYCFTTKF